jgi:hypothetical protein
MPSRTTQESCRPRVSDRTMVGTVPSGSCLQGVRVERQVTAMKPTAISSHATASCVPGGTASFLRHGEIYRYVGELSAGQAFARPSPQLFDEFPVGYSLARCSPAEHASASPTASHLAVRGQSCRVCVRRRSCHPRTGLDAKKKSGYPAREKCFLLDIPSYRTGQRKMPGT